MKVRDKMKTPEGWLVEVDNQRGELYVVHIPDYKHNMWNPAAQKLDQIRLVTSAHDVLGRMCNDWCTEMLGVASWLYEADQDALGRIAEGMAYEENRPNQDAVDQLKEKVGCALAQLRTNSGGRSC